MEAVLSCGLFSLMLDNTAIPFWKQRNLFMHSRNELFIQYFKNFVLLYNDNLVFHVNDNARCSAHTHKHTGMRATGSSSYAITHDKY